MRAHYGELQDKEKFKGEIIFNITTVITLAYFQFMSI